MKVNYLINIAIQGISLFILLFIYSYFAIQRTGNNDFLILATNLLIILYSWYHIFNVKTGTFSLQQMFYLFALFFFGFAPLIQYKYSVATVVGYFFYNDTYLYINLILLAAFLFGDVIYNITLKKVKLSVPYIGTNFKLNDNIILKLILIFLVISIVIYHGYVNHFNLHSLLFRGGQELAREKFDSSVMRHLFGIIVKPIPVFIFIHYYLWGKNILLKFFFLLCVIFIFFPSAMARLFVAAYYIPILIVIFPFFRKAYYFTLTYTFSLLIIFPIFELFRNFNERIFLHFGEYLIQVLYKVYTGMTYDSYQSLAFVVQNNFITYGKQLIGVLLLWVPRSFWFDKPIGSGYTVAMNYNLGWDNISMNFLGEGYVNFGLFGIFLYMAVLAIIMAILDKKYWVSYKGNIYNLFTPFFLVIFSNLTFLLRGDMMFGTTVIVGTLLSCYITQRIFLIFRSNYK